MKTRPDSALSHLYEGELCIAIMKNGEKQQVRWSIPHWCFFYANTETPTVCSFDDIEEWRLATIKV